MELTADSSKEQISAEDSFSFEKSKIIHFYSKGS
jgi:hypothetical protein